jgi:hypothetical protein
MVYEALCEFTNTPQDKDIVKLINPEKLSVNQNTLKDTLNSIYDFKLIGMVCNMLEGTNPEQAKLYRQRLANLISQ